MQQVEQQQKNRTNASVIWSKCRLSVQPVTPPRRGMTSWTLEPSLNETPTSYKRMFLNRASDDAQVYMYSTSILHITTRGAVRCIQWNLLLLNYRHLQFGPLPILFEPKSRREHYPTHKPAYFHVSIRFANGTRNRGRHVGDRLCPVSFECMTPAKVTRQDVK